MDRRIACALAIIGLAALGVLGWAASFSSCVRPKSIPVTNLTTAETVFSVVGGLGAFAVVPQFARWASKRLGISLPPPGSLLRYPQSIFFLLVVGGVAALVGGWLWDILNHVNEEMRFMCESAYSGGQHEPHGTATIIWPVVTMTPVLATAGLLLNRHRGISWANHGALAIWFLGGMCLASLAFYDLPLAGHKGVRVFLVGDKDTILGELLLAFIWAAVISTLAFGTRAIISIAFARTPSSSDHLNMIPLQVGLCTGLVVFGVAMYLAAFPLAPGPDPTRGFVAGAALRVSLFIGLLLVPPAVRSGHA